MKNYKKYIFLLITVFVSICFYSARIKQEPTYLYWTKNKKLEFSDFKALPKIDSKYSGVSVVGIVYSFTYDSEKYSVNILTRFNADSSWLKVKDSLLLNHEQRHFDLADASARKFRHIIFESKFTKGNLKNKLKEIYNDVRKSEDDYHNMYDTESNFSTNKTGQLIWNRKIDSLLNLYPSFSSDSITLINGRW